MTSINRLSKFTSVFGTNWVIGRYLLPELVRLGHCQCGVLLDLACGESPFRLFFPKAEAYIRIDRNSLDPEVTLGDMLAIPLKNNVVDMVLLFQAITDVSSPGEVLREIKRILKPGGKLLVFESMDYPEHDAPYDYYRLMPEGLRFLALDAGLHMEECIRLGGLFTRVASLWNNCLMNGLRTFPVLLPLASLGTACCNLLCYALDRLAPYPHLASDYLAVLVLNDVTMEVLSSSRNIQI